ncbi:MAG: hypothetical protein WAO08_12320 [Hyphomicrobiaceae bacterium]
MAHRITIEPTEIRGERGQRYRVYFEGAVLIEDCWNPEMEACRALTECGITGRLETWRTSATCPAIIIPDIARAAGRTVVENDKIGPVLATWKPRPEDSWSDADPYDNRIAPAAEKILDGVSGP